MDLKSPRMADSSSIYGCVGKAESHLAGSFFVSLQNLKQLHFGGRKMEEGKKRWAKAVSPEVCS